MALKPEGDEGMRPQADPVRQRFVRIMLTEKEHMTLKIAATAEGVNLATYARDVVYAAAIQRVRKYFSDEVS
jgi:hypothetical protein